MSDVDMVIFKKEYDERVSKGLEGHVPEDDGTCEEEKYEICSIDRRPEYRNYLAKLRQGGERTLDFVLPEIQSIN